MAKDTWEVFQDDDEIKVIVSGSLEVGSGWRSYSDVCSEINNLDDAKLIASAPELLDAVLDLKYKLYGNGAANPKIEALLKRLTGE
ncbi:hypothetical protein BIS47_08 [Klebsiella phage vB_KpnM_BIS47]|uniref:Uncharacterized protein n=1 Tax=Klebsiella phage vB_KpnM_BIS47 TaxID=1907784 RepID=A0A1V0E6J2_9CAUD|nr:hypothetical protein BIS47_08 [Klebsiella phage vB_KpnM_BIS47]ARB12512.1 hypothetical protein BIS47_08 [Klebsiella phage vB_KpnM_BIS47]